jgi:drug/metabolite transporter (DMT)-like permease
MNIPAAIGIKLISVVLFAIMSALIRYTSQTVPLGELVFFRAAFALIPVVAVYAWRRELAAAVRTERPFGHLGRGTISLVGMFLNFAALARLPLVDVTAINFASPLVTVVFAVIFLHERVRVYRWTAVGVGFLGVIVMLWPYLTLADTVLAGTTAAAVGVACAVGSAFTNAGSVIQTRRLTDSEHTASIVFYFSLICAIAGAVTLPFVWYTPTLIELTALIAIGVLGGASHIMLTESYRYAPASVVAPFDYTSMLWAFLIGYIFLGEVTTIYLFVGAGIVVASGLFVIWRERQLGVERLRTTSESAPVGK